MIKRTIYIGNPAYLSLRLQQMVVRLEPKNGESQARTIPIEDIGVVLLDHPQITITHALLGALLEQNCAVVTCTAAHIPSGLLLPLAGHTLQSEPLPCSNRCLPAAQEAALATNYPGKDPKSSLCLTECLRRTSKEYARMESSSQER